MHVVQGMQSFVLPPENNNRRDCVSDTNLCKGNPKSVHTYIHAAYIHAHIQIYLATPVKTYYYYLRTRKQPEADMDQSKYI